MIILYAETALNGPVSKKIFFIHFHTSPKDQFQIFSEISRPHLVKVKLKINSSLKRGMFYEL